VVSSMGAHSASQSKRSQGRLAVLALLIGTGVTLATLVHVDHGTWTSVFGTRCQVSDPKHCVDVERTYIGRGWPIAIALLPEDSEWSNLSDVIAAAGSGDEHLFRWPAFGIDVLCLSSSALGALLGARRLRSSVACRSSEATGERRAGRY